jgi:hypothetical protein
MVCQMRRSIGIKSLASRDQRARLAGGMVTANRRGADWFLMQAGALTSGQVTAQARERNALERRRMVRFRACWGLLGNNRIDCGDADSP